MSPLIIMPLIAFAVTGLLITAFCYGAILWATAGQDSRKVRQARAITLIAGVALTLAGTATVLASFIHAENQMMANFGMSPVPHTVNCDLVLHEQLIVQPAANNTPGVDGIVVQIQDHLPDCADGAWSPIASDVQVGPEGQAGPPGSAAYGLGSCFGAHVPPDSDADANARDETRRGLAVGERVVPAGLRNDNDAGKRVQAWSGRDQDNIIVYWGLQGHRPQGDALCSLYDSQQGMWHWNYE